MANKKQAKYATVVFKYYEDPNEPNPNATKLINRVSEAIINYNANSAKYGYSHIDIYGFYIDPDDMDIEEQNELNKDLNTISHNKSKSR